MFAYTEKVQSHFFDTFILNPSMRWNITESTDFNYKQGHQRIGSAFLRFLNTS